MAKSTPTPEETPTPEVALETPETTLPTTVRAKFQCVSLRDFSENNDPKAYTERIHMHPVTSDNPDGTKNENASFSKFTPSGVVELLVTNPAIKGFFETGKEYYIDITPS